MRRPLKSLSGVAIDALPTLPDPQVITPAGKLFHEIHNLVGVLVNLARLPFPRVERRGAVCGHNNAVMDFYRDNNAHSLRSDLPAKVYNIAERDFRQRFPEKYVMRPVDGAAASRSREPSGSTR
jgi:hypothetical protein